MAYESFSFLAIFLDDADDMSPEEKGEYLEAVIRYGLTGEENEHTSAAVRIGFRHAKKMIDASNEKRKSMQKASSTRWKTSKDEAGEMHSDAQPMDVTSSGDADDVHTASDSDAHQSMDDAQVMHDACMSDAEAMHEPCMSDAQPMHSDAQDMHDDKNDMLSISKSISISNSISSNFKNNSLSNTHSSVLSSVSPPVDTDSSSEETEDGTEEKETEEIQRESIECGDAFEAFWTAYPRKESKIAARREWDLAVSGKRITADNTDTVIASVQRHIDLDPHWHNPQYIPYPATYIRDDRWLDDLPAMQLQPVASKPLESYSRSDDEIDLAWKAALRRSWERFHVGKPPEEEAGTA